MEDEATAVTTRSSSWRYPDPASVREVVEPVENVVELVAVDESATVDVILVVTVALALDEADCACAELFAAAMSPKAIMPAAISIIFLDMCFFHEF
jgi:hypothetical protein